ncbi:hypothetical protein MTO96_015950 [Rhipicephalus appendiculatus]
MLVKIKLQPKRNVLSVNAHLSMYSAQEHKQKMKGLQRKLEKVKLEKTLPESDVEKLPNSLESPTTNRDSHVRAEVTAGDRSGPERSNSALSPTRLQSLRQKMGPFGGDGRTQHYVDTAPKKYGVRSKNNGRMWYIETALRGRRPKETWKTRVDKTVKVLQGRSANTVKPHAARQLAAKKKLDALHKQRRRNIQCTNDVKATAFARMKAVEAAITALEALVERAPTQNQQLTSPQVAEHLDQKYIHREGVESIAIPHLPQYRPARYQRRHFEKVGVTFRPEVQLQGRRQEPHHSSSAQPARTSGGTQLQQYTTARCRRRCRQKVDVTSADAQGEAVNSPLDLTSLLRTPDWRLVPKVPQNTAWPSGSLMIPLKATRRHSLSSGSLIGPPIRADINEMDVLPRS